VPTTSPTDNHGLVRPWERDRSFHLEGLPPSPQLERVVDRHWIVRWDLRGREPFQQEVLPHPSVNLVIEPDGSWVWGVPTTRDVRLLQGEGWAVGTKFKPGAFTALTGIEASKITDGRVSLKAAFGHDLNHHEFEAARGALYAVVAKIEAGLAPRADVDDPDAALVTEVIQSIRHVGPNTRVEQLAAMHHVAPRTLQRLFRRYVGVGPKWVLKRLRIATRQPNSSRQRVPLHGPSSHSTSATTTTPTSSATSGSSSDAHPPNTPPKRPGDARTRTSVRGEEAMPRCA
jgi:AraC-like DNA-binding protein